MKKDKGKSTYTDYFDLFNIDKDDTGEQIKEKVRGKIKKFHPDTNDSTSVKQYDELITLSKVILEKEQRDKYIESGHDSYVEQNGISTKYYDFNPYQDDSMTNTEAETTSLIENNYDKLNPFDDVSLDIKDIEDEEYDFTDDKMENSNQYCNGSSENSDFEQDSLEKSANNSSEKKKNKISKSIIKYALVVLFVFFSIVFSLSYILL
jgi:curved DNA-binding protein CbpA